MSNREIPPGVELPIQKPPSGPKLAALRNWPDEESVTGNSVMTPLGVICPTAGAVTDLSTNHPFPSGPAITLLTPVLEMPVENSLIACVTTSIRPIALVVPPSANQMFPSEPKVGIPGLLPGLRPLLYSLMA